jgi:hypothetical protein
MIEILERLVAAGIELVPASEVVTHYIFTRDGFAALVERRTDGSFGGIGGTGILMEQGLAPFVVRGSKFFFVARGFEQEATPDQVESVKRFSADLKQALTSR